MKISQKSVPVTYNLLGIPLGSFTEMAQSMSASSAGLSTASDAGAGNSTAVSGSGSGSAEASTTDQIEQIEQLITIKLQVRDQLSCGAWADQRLEYR